MIIVITGVIPTGPHHLTKGAETDAEERETEREKEREKRRQMARRYCSWTNGHSLSVPAREKEGKREEEMRRIATADLITRREERKATLRKERRLEKAIGNETLKEP